MEKYVKIVKYMSGESIEEQLSELFFAKNNCITTKDIAEMMVYFNVVRDSDFDSENVVFVPNKYCLKSQEKRRKELDK